jgi:hypothetical protein
MMAKRKEQPKPEPHYQLTLSQSQAYVVRDALEAYARLKHGQMATVVEDAFQKRIWEDKINRQAVRAACDLVKLLIFPELNPNAHLGIGENEFPEATTAWEAMTVIRHRLAHDWHDENMPGEEKGYGVQYHTPMSFSGDALPTIQRVENKS